MSRAVGITSNTIPWEILRAAGYSPRLLDQDAGPTPYADRYMEEVFDGRYRVIFDRLCGGVWNDLDMVVVSRTSEQEHKLYLYLREVSREHIAAAMPKLYLYNLLHTRTPESYDYGLERTRQMVHDFEVSDSALREAILESNRARTAVREIQRKRHDGFLEGSDAIDLIGGFYVGDRSVFPERVAARLSALPAPVAGDRPRIFIKGAPLDSAALHRIVEEAGGYVIAEDDWRGSRAAGDQNVHTDADPVTAIFEKYFYDEMSPRIQPASERDAWFHREVNTGRADGVLFYLPLADDVAGWDYPRQAAWLAQCKLPNLVIRDVATSKELRDFIPRLTRRQAW